jgi:hypothetical protein
MEKLEEERNSILYETIRTFPVLKFKAIPLQACTGPQGPRNLSLPDFKAIGT